ncbi:MAG: zinc metallopeptidase [Candidatus Sumerlaeota bacterium]|nr:zinc metallopeptidase [Candidatus Sumerlaeota bacterium]
MGTYLVFILPALLFAMWAQYKVKSAYEKYSHIASSTGLSGAEAAAHMLQGMGLQVVPKVEMTKGRKDAVAIEAVSGFLSDHYDPRSRVLRLSPDVYKGESLAALGIACHEAGHALQHASNYAPLDMRSLMVPTASFGSWLAVPLIIAGAAFARPSLVMIGIALFSIIVLFQIITLPVEFNASCRAKRAMLDLGIIQTPAERAGVSAVLNAAAMTYVAAAVSSVMTLLYYTGAFRSR